MIELPAPCEGPDAQSWEKAESYMELFHWIATFYMVTHIMYSLFAANRTVNGILA